MVDYLLATPTSTTRSSTRGGSSGGSTTPDDYSNSADTATQLALQAGQSLRTTGSIGRSVVDFFKFQPSVNGRLELNVGALNSTLDTAVDVYDAPGSLLATNDNAGFMRTDSRVTIDVIAGEIYFIRARGSGGRTGDYAMTIDWLLVQGV
jgi:hypothetical protein